VLSHERYVEELTSDFERKLDEERQARLQLEVPQAFLELCFGSGRVRRFFLSLCLCARDTLISPVSDMRHCWRCSHDTCSPRELSSPRVPNNANSFSPTCFCPVQDERSELDKELNEMQTQLEDDIDTEIENMKRMNEDKLAVSRETTLKYKGEHFSLYFCGA
jgi:hypothetical protein